MSYRGLTTLHANYDHNQTKTKESTPFILTGRMRLFFF